MSDDVWKRDEVDSPCVKICVIHPEEKLCIGCLRTLDEIAGWSAMTREQRLVLTIAVLASFVSFLDGTIVNVALPAIVRELGGGIATQQWVVDAYLITLGALILVAGSISDLYGRIRVIRIGLIGFGQRRHARRRAVFHRPLIGALGQLDQAGF